MGHAKYMQFIKFVNPFADRIRKFSFTKLNDKHQFFKREYNG